MTIYIRIEPILFLKREMGLFRFFKHLNPAFMTAETKTFPNIPVSNWIKVREQFKKTIPGTITGNYLASILGMSEVSAKSNIMPSLKQAGLIDDSGKTNQDLAKKFRDDGQYKEFCNGLLKKLYPTELLDAFPDKDSDIKKIKAWFMNHSGVGEVGAGRLAAFYVELVSGEVKQEKKSDSKQTAPRPKIVKESKGKSPAPPQTKHTEEQVQTQNSSKSNPDIHINIQIHISSDASPDQIKSIFENMSKYVYKSDK